jgi:DNA-binding CsgD family transcriptional regulator
MNELPEISPSPHRDSAVISAELMNVPHADLLQALEAVQVPAFASDQDRRVRWQNAAAIALVGDLRGKLDRSVVVPEDLTRVRDAFARKQMGALHTDYEVTVVASDGRRVRLAVSSVPLRHADNGVVGSFALARVLEPAEPAADLSPRLTARQRQTLTLLAAGCSTAHMAELMGLSQETVRNHVKRLLRRLDTRSRVEAVAKARQAQLV